jgi:hypothetical protein
LQSKWGRPGSRYQGGELNAVTGSTADT